MQKTPLCTILALVFSVATAQATTTPMVDGVSNGVPTKYNKTCLDVAYKNAKEDINGNKTDSKDFPNTKCYKDGIEIYCNEIREDGQTEKAKEDDFIEKLPNGNACVKVPTPSSKVYEGTVASCDDITYKNAYEAVCGVPGNVSSFKCYKDHIEIDCTKLTDQAQIDKAQDACDEANAKCNLAVTCPYGGKINSSNVCECNEKPDCTGTYGGKPKGDGTQECDYYAAPNCNAICSSGSGTPKANGTQDCSCQSAITSTDTKCWENYDDIGCYININTSYRDNNSVTISTTCDNHGCYSNIDFRNAPKDQSNIVVKINGTKYEFLANDRGCGLTDAKSWCLDNDISIIEESKNYTIEFLN